MRVSKPLQQAVVFGLVLLAQGVSHAQLPSGGTVVSGSASVNQSGSTQVINQGTSRAIIDWQNFSIGAGNTVRFNQPNAYSIILNRVIGNNPSSIFGNMTANGQVFLVNPAGVYFGAGATVDVGGLIATTMNIRNEDFMAGNYVFNRDNLLAGRREVINAGILKARDNGYIVLAGDYAANSGVVQARLGTVALASGNKMTLDINGDNLINFTVNEKTVADLSGVDNSGQLLADGGRAIMTAAVARDLATATVNNSGLVRAQSTVERDGAIYLSADGGNTQVSGTLDASGTAQGRKGGTIDVLGNRVALTDNAKLDASGDASGGTIRVGGAFQGQGPQQNAKTAYVGKEVQIKADALGNGDGGNVVVWSNDLTRYYGNISARGGAQGGNGGNVEVSGKAKLDFNGTANTLAPKGKAGTLLLDPSDIEILNTIGATPDMTASSPFKDATDNGGTSQMTVAALETALAGGNVTVTTTTTAGTAPKGGTITIDDGGGGGVQWTTANTLRLQADNKILIKSTVEGYNGTLWLDSANGVTQSPGAVIGANSLLLTGGGFFDLVGVTPSNFIGSWNNVGTLAANLSNGSTLRYSANQNLTVGTVSGVSGVNVGTSGSAQFYHDKGNSLTLAQGITANSMYFRGNGAVNQTGGTLQVSSVGIAGSSNVSLTAANNIGTIGVSASGPVTINNSGRLTIGTGTFGVAGITTNNNNVTITTGDAAGFDATKLPDGTNPASLTLNESINAGTGTVKLTVGTGGVYQRHDVDSSTSLPLANGSITADNLLLQGSSSSKVTPFVLNNAKNLVKTIAGRANGSISYTGGPLTVGTVGGVSGIATTSNTIVVPAGVDSSGRATPDVYNDNNISLSVGGDLNINQNINAATTTGSGAVSLGMGGDFNTKTATGVRVDANTLGVFGDDLKGTFNIVTKTSNLAAAGGKVMVIDNTAQTGDLTGIGIGAPATNTTATSGSSTVTVNSSSKPVGDFYLTTGGNLNILKLLSQGDNLLLRANSLNILLDAGTKDGARIMLQPYNMANKIGINNSSDTDFTADTNYSSTLLLKFTNPTATFFFGTPQNVIMNDTNVQAAAKNTQTGSIHIGSDGPANLGYRSISAQTTGSIVAHDVGPLYNLRLVAPSLTVNAFNTFGDQIHFFSDNLSLPGSAANYINPNKPTITLRPLNDETVWIGLAPSSKSRPAETQILSQYIVKLPDGSTVVISGSTDYPFPAGGPGYGDIHIPWDDTLSNSLGNRKLVLSTAKGVYTYARTPNYTKNNDGGTSGGLWKGCQNLTVCKGSNPSPYPDPTTPDPGTNPGPDPGIDKDPIKPIPGGCDGCPPAPPNDNPYPPTVTPGPDNNPGACTKPEGCNGTSDPTPTDGNPGSECTSPDGCGGDGGGDPGGGCNDPAGCDGGGDPKPTDGNPGGECTSPDGCGGDGGGDPGGGCNDPAGCDGGGDPKPTDGNPGGECTSPDGCGGDGGGNPGGGCNDPAGCDGGGDPKPTDGNSGGECTSPDGCGGDGGGNPGGGCSDASSCDGNNTTGTGDGDGGNGDGNGNCTSPDGCGGDGGGNNGNGGDGDGDGTNGDGKGDGKGNGGDGDGKGNGSGGGDGDGNGDGSGDGGSGNGNGGTGDGDGDGTNGDGKGDGKGNGGDGDGKGNGSGGGDGDGNGDGSGDGGSGNGNGGTGDGDGDGNGNGDGTGDGKGNGSGGGDGDGNGDGGAGNGSGGTGDGSGDGSGNGSGAGDGDGSGNGGGDGDGSGDGGSSTNSGGSGDGSDSGSGDGSSSATGINISCDSVTASKKEEKTGKNKTGQQELVEISRDGVKMRDPCQEQPDQPKQDKK